MKKNVMKPWFLCKCLFNLSRTLISYPLKLTHKGCLVPLFFFYAVEVLFTQTFLTITGQLRQFALNSTSLTYPHH